MLRNSLLLISCLALASCSGIKAQLGGAIGPATGNDVLEDSNVDSHAYAADGYKVVVYRIGKGNRPTFVSGVTVTCVASNPKRRIDKETDVNGSVHFSVRGPAQFWVEDELGHVYEVQSAAESSDTVPNQGYIEFKLPFGDQDD